MTDEISILVATMSGTAEMLADELADQLDGYGLKARVRRMEEVPVQALRPGIYLICTSTYGVGEVPANAQALYEGLAKQKPDLTGVRYGVVGLGDSLYPNTFCFGGKLFDEALQALGAQRVGERLEHDSRSGEYPEDATATWLETWVPLLQAGACQE